MGAGDRAPTAESIILGKSGKWVAPGHNSVITDGGGQDWMLYHAVDVAKPRAQPADDVNTRRVMLVDRIEWRDSWPVVSTR